MQRAGGENKSTTSTSPNQLQHELQEALNKQDSREVYRLIRNGASINAINKDGNAPLHQCIINGNLEAVKLLVDYGADITMANRDGWNAVHIASFKGQRDIVNYLIMNHTR